MRLKFDYIHTIDTVFKIIFNTGGAGGIGNNENGGDGGNCPQVLLGTKNTNGSYTYTTLCVAGGGGGAGSTKSGYKDGDYNLNSQVHNGWGGFAWHNTTYDNGYLTPGGTEDIVSYNGYTIYYYKDNDREESDNWNKTYGKNGRRGTAGGAVGGEGGYTSVGFTGYNSKRHTGQKGQGSNGGYGGNGNRHGGGGGGAGWKGGGGGASDGNADQTGDGGSGGGAGSSAILNSADVTNIDKLGFYAEQAYVIPNEITYYTPTTSDIVIT